MQKQSSDKDVLEKLLAVLEISPREHGYDDQGHLIALNFSGLRLSQVPAEIGQLTNLQTLNRLLPQ